METINETAEKVADVIAASISSDGGVRILKEKAEFSLASIMKTATDWYSDNWFNCIIVGVIASSVAAAASVVVGAFGLFGLALGLSTTAVLVVLLPLALALIWLLIGITINRVVPAIKALAKRFRNAETSEEATDIGRETAKVVKEAVADAVNVLKDTVKQNEPEPEY